ncbi:MAG: cupin domain-containing protein [Streptosporangiales bacterium]|nr:cupin domain-containing protein [Streptosporangiales bacterium]
MTTINADSDDQVYEEMSRRGAAPLWRHLGNLFLDEPKSAAVPHLWKYPELRELALHFAGRLSIEEAQRRVIMLVNPGLQDPPATVNTLFAGLQVLMPGEQAPAHRHTANAFRFIIEGSGVYTTVDGERVHMNPGDLLLTAGWQWHDHHHEGDDVTIWLDGLDYPLVNMLECGFFELFPDGVQAPTEPDDISTRQMIHGRLNPVWMNGRPAAGRPIGNYPWAETEKALASVADNADGSAHDGVIFEYANPWTGGAVLPTISCRIQRLRPGFAGKPRQQTASFISHVVRGEGTVTVDGRDYDWGRNDVFAVPGWHEYSLSNASASQDAVIFSYSNEPALRALGLYREQLG